MPIIVIIAATALFTGAIYLTAGFGQPHIDNLSEYVGEENLALARAHREVEDYDGAIKWYENSLDKPFDHAITRVESYLEYIEMLRELGKNDEALRVAAKGYKATDGAGHIYNNYYDLLRTSGQLDAAWSLAEERLARAQARGDSPAIKWSYYHMGAVRRDQNKLDEAYALFQESFDTVPCGDSAYQCAASALALGDMQAAKKFAAQAIELGTDGIRARAESLLKDI